LEEIRVKFIEINYMLKPVVSEKTYGLIENSNCYLFQGDLSYTKDKVKAEVEEMFKVKVVSVKSLVRKGEVRINRRVRKFAKTPNKKMFYVYLKDGDNIKDFKVS